MPTTIKSQLNSPCRAILTAAEINGGVAPFAAVTIQNTSGQVTLVDGIIAQGVISGADANNFNQVITFLQRNLSPSAGQSWLAIQNQEELLLYYQDQAPGLGVIRAEKFTQPVVLQANQVYAAIVGLLPAAPFAGNASLYVNVLGRQVSTSGREFPLELR